MNSNPTNSADLDKVRQDGRAITTIPRERLTEEICRAAVEQNPEVLALLGSMQRSAAVVDAALRQRPDLIKHIPPALRTPAMHERVCANLGAHLKEVPQKDRTERACALAMANDTGAWPHVPQAQRTEAFALEVVRHEPERLADLPSFLRTPVVCATALSHAKDSDAVMKHVPPAMRAAAQTEAVRVAPDSEIAQPGRQAPSPAEASVISGLLTRDRAVQAPRARFGM